ncbi:hypothetical protein N0V88_000611 [Collariella sp. IMI 366227]|nr:hypothetical protein N0V88_000611 [Collariella sp. IMI 366227]
MTPEFEARLQKAVDDGVIPHAVVAAKDKSGKITYHLSVGPNSLTPLLPHHPSTLLSLASMSKLLTSLSILHLIQHNHLTLDTDIARYLPVLAAQPILRGFDATTGAPILAPRTKPILVRHLLTHSAGTGYLLLSDELGQWARATCRPLPVPFAPGPAGGGATVDEKFGYPLLFEPGEGWVYRSSMDWAGRLVEVVSGKQLDEYLYEHVLAPVGVPKGGITFHPAKYTGEYELAGMAVRNRETGKEGLHGGIGEYVKVLHSLAVDDGRILESGTANLLFEPLLREDKARKAMQETVNTIPWVVGWMPKGEDTEYDWSAGGMLTVKEGKEGAYRGKGFLQWGGVWNLSWFIDPTKGACGAFGTQIAFPADPLVTPLMREFEEGVYSKL